MGASISNVNTDTRLKLGSRESKSKDTVYQASADGVVEAFSDVSELSLLGQTDGSNPPTTYCMKQQPRYANDKAGLSMLVLVGDYWKVTIAFAAGTPTVNWIPFETETIEP